MSSDRETVAGSASKVGSAIMGSLTTAALVQVTGDPVIGSTAGAALAAVVEDVRTRTLSRWEDRRVRTMFTYAADRVRQRYAAGDAFRDDDFFTMPSDDRAFFVEITDGVVVAAQREHEERKVPYLGNLVANLAFSPGVDRGSANWALQTASGLTWTQFVLLALVGRESALLPPVNVGKDTGSWESWGVHEAFADLGIGRRELIGAPGRRTENLGLTVPNVTIAEMKLWAGGGLLYELLSLDSVPDDDLQEVIGRLTKPGPDYLDREHAFDGALPPG